MEMKQVAVASKKRRREEMSSSAIQFAFLSFVMIAMFLASASKVLAEVTPATLGGRFIDPHKNVIPGADVVVTSEDTGVQTHASTNGLGIWAINLLFAGKYHFKVTAPGFDTLKHTTFDRQIGDVKSIDVQLNVGNVTTEVVVTDETPLIDTTAAISEVVLDAADLAELPSLSGTTLELETMASGVKGCVQKAFEPETISLHRITPTLQA